MVLAGLGLEEGEWNTFSSCMRVTGLNSHVQYIVVVIANFADLWC